MFILNGHKVHIILEVLFKTKFNDIDMITLPSHTSHGLQSLNVTSFKLFKVILFFNTLSGLRIKKENVANWMSLVLKKVLTKPIYWLDLERLKYGHFLSKRWKLR